MIRICSSRIRILIFLPIPNPGFRCQTGTGSRIRNSVFHTIAHLGTLELPGDVGHDVHSVGAAHTDTEAAQPPTVGGVRVRTHHQQTYAKTTTTNKRLYSQGWRTEFYSKISCFIVKSHEVNQLSHILTKDMADDSKLEVTLAQ
jgi:hypothetical protein